MMTGKLSTNGEHKVQDRFCRGSIEEELSLTLKPRALSIAATLMSLEYELEYELDEERSSIRKIFY